MALAEAAKAGPANIKMLQYVFDQYGKKIGDGVRNVPCCLMPRVMLSSQECYAVAKEALHHAGAKPPSAETPCVPTPPPRADK